MSNFRPIDRHTGFLLPPSVDEWLPAQHLARFVVKVIEGSTCARYARATAVPARAVTTRRYYSVCGLRLCHWRVLQP
jgi:hypothetical protein